MDRADLLSAFQYAVTAALLLIVLTTLYALAQANQTAVAADSDSDIAAGNSEMPPGFALGRTVFRENGCGACHARSMRDDATGPALAGVTRRWQAEPENLFDWIRNSVALAESGRSPRAAEMVNWADGKMSSYPHLDDEQIAALLVYIEAPR